MPKTAIKQHDQTDCGVACLASLFAFYKFYIPVSRIRQLAGTTQKGTNAFGLIEAAKKFGFDGKGVKGDIESLPFAPTPCIAHILIDGKFYHYIVLYQIRKNHVKLMDPSDGKFHRWTKKKFAEKWTGILILISPGSTFKKGNLKISVYSRLWQLVRPHKSILILSLIASIFYTILGFSIAIYLQKLTDYVFVGGNRSLLNLLGFIMVVLLIVQITIGAYKDLFLLRIAQQIDVQLILGYYKHILELPLRFFDTMRVGEIISRISDAVKIRTFINGISLNLIVNFLIILFSFILMFSFYWKLALILTLIIPVYSGIYGVMNMLNKKTERKIMEQSASLESQLVESINTIRTIKRFQLEEFSNFKTETRFVRLLTSGYYSALNSIFSNTSSDGISKISTIVLLWAGSFYVLDQNITVGELMSFYAIIGYFTNPLIYLISSNKDIQNALIAADRLFEIIDLEKEEDDARIKLKRDQIGDILFKDVSFNYGVKVRVFKNLTMRICHQKVTAIVGASGSGKTSIASLLQSLYPIQKGKISIGGINLKWIDRKCLRKRIAVVPQHIDLFAGNVIENIAVGDWYPDIQRIELICKRIGIIDFIERLPEGFATYLGENGMALSGGQRQRIAIARALYVEPEILVLDEATSSLDSTAEQYIQQTILEMQKERKTVIIIAHKLSTIARADQILVLDRGKVKEKGSHQQLIELKGHYYSMWHSQNPVNQKSDSHIRRR